MYDTQKRKGKKRPGGGGAAIASFVEWTVPLFFSLSFTPYGKDFCIWRHANFFFLSFFLPFSLRRWWSFLFIYDDTYVCMCPKVLYIHMAYVSSNTKENSETLFTSKFTTMYNTIARIRTGICPPAETTWNLSPPSTIKTNTYHISITFPIIKYIHNNNRTNIHTYISKFYSPPMRLGETTRGWTNESGKAPSLLSSFQVLYPKPQRAPRVYTYIYTPQILGESSLLSYYSW